MRRLVAHHQARSSSTQRARWGIQPKPFSSCRTVSAMAISLQLAAQDLIQESCPGEGLAAFAVAASRKPRQRLCAVEAAQTALARALQRAAELARQRRRRQQKICALPTKHFRRFRRFRRSQQPQRRRCPRLPLKQFQLPSCSLQSTYRAFMQKHLKGGSGSSQKQRFQAAHALWRLQFQQDASCGAHQQGQPQKRRASAPGLKCKEKAKEARAENLKKALAAKEKKRKEAASCSKTEAQ